MTNTKRSKRVVMQGGNHSTRLAIIFCGLVFGLILFSLAAKLLVIIKNSTFDGQHRFTIAVHLVGNKASVVSFAPINSSVSILQISGVTDSTRIARMLEAPIDGVVKADFLKEEVNGKNIQDTMRLFVFRFPTLQTSLTPVDLVRLWLFSNQVSKHTAYEKSISFAEKNPAVLNDLVTDKISTELFADETIVQEKVSVQIVNVASVVGLGSRCARLIGNMGGNVVSVETAETTEQETTIQYFGKKTYTVSRLEQLLQITALPMQNPGIADIIVTLGKDKANAEAF